MRPSWWRIANRNAYFFSFTNSAWQGSNHGFAFQLKWSLGHRDTHIQQVLSQSAHTNRLCLALRTQDKKFTLYVMYTSTDQMAYHLLTWFAGVIPALRDYCETDTFRAHCPHGEVVLMQEARYGRMGVGTCLEIDIGFMGCFRYVWCKLNNSYCQRSSDETWIVLCLMSSNYMAFPVTSCLIWTDSVLGDHPAM